MNDNFSVPICNSFKAYILNDQLCYQVDLNKWKRKFSPKNLKLGVTFFVDNNEERQFSWNNEPNTKEDGGKCNEKLCFAYV